MTMSEVEMRDRAQQQMIIATSDRCVVLCRMLDKANAELAAAKLSIELCSGSCKFPPSDEVVEASQMTSPLPPPTIERCHGCDEPIDRVATHCECGELFPPPAEGADSNLFDNIDAANKCIKYLRREVSGKVALAARVEELESLQKCPHCDGEALPIKWRCGKCRAVREHASDRIVDSGIDHKRLIGASEYLEHGANMKCSGDEVAKASKVITEQAATIADLRGQLEAETTDLELICGEVSKVYYDLTGGKFSKPNTASGYVIDEVRDIHAKELDEKHTECVEIQRGHTQLEQQLEDAERERDGAKENYDDLNKVYIKLQGEHVVALRKCRDAQADTARLDRLEHWAASIITSVCGPSYSWSMRQDKSMGLRQWIDKFTSEVRKAATPTTAGEIKRCCICNTIVGMGGAVVQTGQHHGKWKCLDCYRKDGSTTAGEQGDEEPNTFPTKFAKTMAKVHAEPVHSVEERIEAVLQQVPYNTKKVSPTLTYYRFDGDTEWHTSEIEALTAIEKLQADADHAEMVEQAPDQFEVEDEAGEGGAA